MSDPPPPSPKRALIGLLAIAAAVGVVLFVMHQLREAGVAYPGLRDVRAHELRADRQQRSVTAPLADSR